MVETAAIRESKTPRVFLRSSDRRMRRVGAVDVSLRLQRDRASDGAAAGADIEDAHRSTNEADGIVNEVLALGTRHEHGFVHHKAATVELRVAEQIRDRYAGAALFAELRKRSCFCYRDRRVAVSRNPCALPTQDTRQEQRRIGPRRRAPFCQRIDAAG